MSVAARRKSLPPSPEQCLRMKDLCEATGLERQAIHFYIQQGLLPPGRKTGRNMAWYSNAHLERLRTIRQLQHERFLPLKAIKALLEGRDEDFTPDQHVFLASVKSRLDASMSSERDPSQSVDAEELIRRAGVLPEDLAEAISLGLVGAITDPSGRERIAQADAWMVDLFGHMRAIGFTRERGFTVADIAFYEEAMSKLFREEMRLVSQRLSHLSPEEVARMIERALPIIHTFLTRYHATRVKDFFGSL